MSRSVRMRLIALGIFALGACLVIFTQVLALQIAGLVIGVPAFLVFAFLLLKSEATEILGFGRRALDEGLDKAPLDTAADDLSRNDGRFVPPEK